MFLNPEIAGLSIAAILFAALVMDAVFGEFGPLFRVIPHPVALIGGLVGWLDRRLNREQRSAAARRARGAV
ncbi:MAG: cobalamin biosynthesis protein, partial [Proteobacteria bacterium]|nr:cobalamin biosynthesis protein [Pseudomonadota bacterium]